MTKARRVTELAASRDGAELGLAGGEEALHQHRGERHDDCLPESAQQRHGNHDQQAKQGGHRQQPLKPVRKSNGQHDGHDTQRALQRKQEHARPGAAHCGARQKQSDGNVGTRQPAPPSNRRTAGMDSAHLERRWGRMSHPIQATTSSEAKGHSKVGVAALPAHEIRDLNFNSITMCSLWTWL